MKALIALFLLSISFVAFGSPTYYYLHDEPVPLKVSPDPYTPVPEDQRTPIPDTFPNPYTPVPEDQLTPIPNTFSPSLARLSSETCSDANARLKQQLGNLKRNCEKSLHGAV